jgi:cytidyltransferase-like protein
MKLVICTGGFDPLHSGHVRYLKEARDLGDTLLVGINSDSWLTRKKGAPFMPFEERAAVVKHLEFVDSVTDFDDSDGSAIKLLEWAKKNFPYAEILFANGGDRTDKNIPEMSVEGVKFAFGIGGFNKANSSSWILEEWKTPKTERPWGYYRILHSVEGTKVKELTLNPGQSISMQRHFERYEHWHVSEGSCVVYSQTDSGYGLPPKTLHKHDYYNVVVNDWHQLSNPFEEPCRIVEIQYGARCDEDDIERR